jgi:hypothetical protein
VLNAYLLQECTGMLDCLGVAQDEHKYKCVCLNAYITSSLCVCVCVCACVRACVREREMTFTVNILCPDGQYDVFIVCIH